MREEITDDIDEGFTFTREYPYDYEIELKHVPLKILSVRGYNDSSTKKFKWVNIYPQHGGERRTFTQEGKKVFYDLWSLDGKTLTITDGRGAGYGPSDVKGDPEATSAGEWPYFKIKYRYADTYDPRFVPHS